MLELCLDPESRALAGADLQPADADISGVVREAVRHQRGLDFVVRAAFRSLINLPVINIFLMSAPQLMACSVLQVREVSALLAKRLRRNALIEGGQMLPCCLYNVLPGLHH